MWIAFLVANEQNADTPSIIEQTCARPAKAAIDRVVEERTCTVPGRVFRPAINGIAAQQSAKREVDGLEESYIALLRSRRQVCPERKLLVVIGTM